MRHFALHIYLLLERLQVQQDLLLLLLLSHYQLADLLHHHSAVADALLHDHYGQAREQVADAVG